MPIAEIDAKANHVEQLYWDLEREAPHRAEAVFEDFRDVLRFEESPEELFVSRTAEDLSRVQQCKDALVSELNALGGMRCADCGQARRFVRRQTVEEIVELDARGEFVREIDAATKHVSKIECYECDSEAVEGI